MLFAKRHLLDSDVRAVLSHQALFSQMTDKACARFRWAQLTHKKPGKLIARIKGHITGAFTVGELAGNDGIALVRARCTANSPLDESVLRRIWWIGVNAKVIVMPKAAVLDPQGNAVRDAMRHLGMPEVRSVRIGKYMEIEIEGQDGELESRLQQLCRDLLSNPVIEDYELQRTDVGRQTSEVRDQKKTPNADKSRAGAQRPTRKTKSQRKTL